MPLGMGVPSGYYIITTLNVNGDGSSIVVALVHVVKFTLLQVNVQRLSVRCNAR